MILFIPALTRRTGDNGFQHARCEDQLLGWSSTGASPAALAAALMQAAPVTTCPIEEVPLGSRVLEENPQPEDVLPTWPENLGEPWYLIQLTTRHPDGSVVDIEFLRPESWLLEHRWRPGPLGSFQTDRINWEGLGVDAYDYLKWGVVAHLWDPEQPKRTHLPRNLHWVDIHLWDVFAGIDNQEFIRSLYRRKINGEVGGWLME